MSFHVYSIDCFCANCDAARAFVFAQDRIVEIDTSFVDNVILSNAEYEAEALADAKQEALTDDTCYCDDVDICPPCMRYLAAQQPAPQAPRGVYPRPTCAFVTDTTLAVKLTPEQQALFDAELPF